MAYTPNPTDVLEPVVTRPAGSAAEEFRALKAYIQTLAVNAGKSSGVRQTVVQGVTDNSGYAAFLAAGTGLTVKLLATARAVVFAFAAGYNATVGAIDNYAQLTTDTDPVVSGLETSNTSLITVDYVSVSSVTWGKYLVPPDYSYAFDRSRGALLNFEGADASTTILDDFGNTWTAVGNAQIDTAQFKFGGSSLLLDGTGDYAESTSFTNLGSDSWEMSAWFRANATTGIHGIYSFQNAADFGVVISLDHNAGTRRVRFDFSTNGTTFDQTGLGTAVISLATWYKVRLVFDALAGNYKLYLSNNGAAETLEATVASAVRVNAIITKSRIGGNTGGGIIVFNGWIDAVRFVRAATKTATETPSASAPAITEHPYHWFSIPEMRMYEVTSASVTAGVNPGITEKNRLFVGECDTSGVAVTAVRNYALRGEFEQVHASALANNAEYSFNHNIGVIPKKSGVTLFCVSPDAGWYPQEEVAAQDLDVDNVGNGRGISGPGLGKNFAALATGAGMSTTTMTGRGTPLAAITVARWKPKLYLSRGW